MGTEFWHPDMDDRRSEETRQSLLDMVADIRKDTGEIRVALFGIPGQEWMGHIPTTERRLENHGKRIATVERRIWLWIGALGVLVPATVWIANALLR